MILTVADRLALTDLVHRYAAAVDDGRFDDVVELFAPTAELTLPAPPEVLAPVRAHTGRDAIVAAVRGAGAVVRTEHAIVGEVYDGAPGDGVAVGRIACVAHHWSYRDGEPADVVWHLHYGDEYVHTDGGWLIARRALTINAIETRTLRRLRPRDGGV